MAQSSSQKAEILKRSFSELFEIPTYETWRQEAERLLKGAPFDRRMYTSTPEGITLQPMYTREDIADLPWLASLPGEPPFVRGQRAVTGRWLVTQRYAIGDLSAAATAIGHDVTKGLGAIVLEGPPDSRGVLSVDAIERALGSVDPTSLPVVLESDEHGLTALAMLVAAARRRELATARLRGAIAADPVGSLLRRGQLAIPLSDSLDHLAVVTAWGIEIAPSLGTIWVHGDWHHNAGANAVQELAGAMATGLLYLRELERRGLVPETVLPRMRFSFGVGTSFFMEIAKLRAARVLWHRLLEVADVDPDDRSMWMHGRTSQTNLSRLDPHTNLLRLTSGAIAATIAGVDSIEVDAFDLSETTPGEFARRLARNTQLVLAEEVHLDTVTDPAGGCWYIEWLTHQLAERSWEMFQQIEERGGMLEVVTSGWWQDQVTQVVEDRRREYATRESILVGVSKYPASPSAEVRTERAAASVSEQTADRGGDQIAVKRALDEIQKYDRSDTELVEAAIGAAGAGATSFAIENALVTKDDRQAGVRALSSFRAAEPFETIHRAVREAMRSRPQLAAFMIGLGPIRQYMPRVDFAAGFMEVGGFEVQRSAGFDDVSQTVAKFAESGCMIALICGTDNAYAERAVDVVTTVRAKDDTAVIVLAGLLPDALREKLSQAGVDFFIHLGSDVPEVLGKIANRLGVKV